MFHLFLDIIHSTSKLTLLTIHTPYSSQSGYVELRKGTHTYLTADGRLVVLKHNVLRPDLVVNQCALSVHV